MFDVESHGKHKIVTPTKDINPGSAPQAKDFIRNLIDTGDRSLIVDLSNVTFLDSSALGVLVTAMKTARAVGGDVRLCGLSPQLQQILELTRLTRVFDVYPDRTSALD